MSGAVPSLVQTADRCGRRKRGEDDRGMKGMKGSGACSGVVTECVGVWVVVCGGMWYFWFRVGLVRGVRVGICG